jgi:hypothetical protein
MASMRPWLAVILIAVSSCGGSKSPASDRAGSGAGSTGQAGGPGGGGARGAAGSGTDASAGVDVGAAGAGGGAPDAASEDLAVRPIERADGAGVDTSADEGFETQPRVPGSRYRALAVATGSRHTCAILDNHRIKCWGDNDYGALGLGDTQDRGSRASEMGDNLPFVDLGTGRTAVAVAAGRYHTCALLDDGTVKCWGFEVVPNLPPSQYGQWGGAPGEMGDHLPTLVFGAGGHAAKLIASGIQSSCAVLDDQSVWCWGDGSAPAIVPLGAHAAAVQLAPWGYGARALFADHTVSQALPIDRAQLFQPTNVVYIAGSESLGCAALGDGTADCAEPGPTPFPEVGAPLAGLLALGLDGSGLDLCGLFAGGAVRCWGSCAEGPIGANVWCGPELADHSKPAMLGLPAVALTTNGLSHICALLADGGVKCWTLDGCGDDSDSTPCGMPDVPAQDAQNANLGSSVDIVTTNGVRHYGAWHEIDLGEHP